jgi:hypothetical protein
MKYKGITYDVGTEYTSGSFSRSGLTREVIEKDIFEIKNNLNCNSVRIYGTKKDLLILATEEALKSGLNVWLSPRLINQDVQTTINFLEEIAKEVEILKSIYGDKEIVFIIAGEATIDLKGFLEGETIYDRIRNISKPSFFIKKAFGIKPKYQEALDNFLDESLLMVRKSFSGKVTYASAMWEIVDWTNFDFVSVNLYKASFNKSFFNKIIRKMKSKGKPLAITEFGCCTYLGADKKGPTGYTILDTTTEPPTFKEKRERDERTQADYIADLLQTFEKEGVAATFIFDFYEQKLTYSSNPGLDYDKASFAVTKSIGENKWKPKKSFSIISEYYRIN